MHRPKPPKRRNRVRQVTDEETIPGIQRNAWGDPIGARDVGGGWYVEPKAGRFKA